MHIPIHAQTRTQDHHSSYTATEVLCSTNKSAFPLLCVCAAETESSSVPMMDEMSLLQEYVEQNRAEDASSFIEPTFINTEPPESKVRNVHTLKLSSFSKHITVNCVQLMFSCNLY